MSAEEISTIHFAVFVQGRGLHDWEWESIELLRTGGATCLFILAPDAMLQRPGVSQALEDLVLRIAGLPAERRTRVEELDPRRYQPAVACPVERTGTGEPTVSSAQRLQLSERGLKFILFFGADEIPKGLGGCAEL